MAYFLASNDQEIFVTKQIAAGDQAIISECSLDGYLVKIFYKLEYEEDIYLIKINALRNSLRIIEKYIKKTARIVIPFDIIVDEKRHFLGYLMTKEDHPELSRCFFELDSFSFPSTTRDRINNDNFVEIVADLFESLYYIHKTKVCLGDIRPDNILIDNEKRPIFIDVDSAQIDDFPCLRFDKKYSDYSVINSGVKKKLRHSIETDIYALTLVCFELIVGIHPFTFLSHDSNFEQRRKQNINILHFFHTGNQSIGGISIMRNNPLTTKIFHRLQELKCTSSAVNDADFDKQSLYNFFVSVLVNNERKYFKNNKHFKSLSVEDSLDRVVINPVNINFEYYRDIKDSPFFSDYIKQYFK